jgi:hypothetical protein
VVAVSGENFVLSWPGVRPRWWRNCPSRTISHVLMICFSGLFPIYTFPFSLLFGYG